MEPNDRIRRHFDDLGDGEWEPLDADPRSQVAFEVQRRLLAELYTQATGSGRPKG
jgi:hypothetical protein